MTEKRFTLKEYDDYNYVAFDGDKPMIHLKLESFGSYGAFHRIIDKLNEQSDKLDDLTRINTELEIRLSRELTRVDALKEENKELTHELEGLKNQYSIR